MSEVKMRVYFRLSPFMKKFALAIPTQSIGFWITTNRRSQPHFKETRVRGITLGLRISMIQISRL